MKTSIDAIGEALNELAQNGEIELLSQTEINEFAKKHPKQFIHSADKELLGTAIGMSLEDKTPFVHTCVSGTNWERIRSIAYNGYNVKIIDTHEGSPEDVGMAGMLPNITIITPADYHEAKKAIIAAGIMKGPVYIKLAKKTQQTTNAKTPFIIGRAEIMKAGKDCTIIASGTILPEALQAAEKLSKQEIECTVLDCHTIKPLDKHAIISSAKITRCIVVAEPYPGLGSGIAEILGQHAPVPTRIIRQDIENVARIAKAVKEVVLQRCEKVCTEIPEEHGKRMFPELQPELYFRLHDGKIIKSIPGLQKALLDMDNETFSHHCNNHKNDFSNWIKEVFKEPILAEQLKQSKTRVGMILAITKWLK